MKGRFDVGRRSGNSSSVYGGQMGCSTDYAYPSSSSSSFNNAPGHRNDGTRSPRPTGRRNSAGFSSSPVLAKDSFTPLKVNSTPSSAGYSQTCHLASTPKPRRRRDSTRIFSAERCPGSAVASGPGSGTPFGLHNNSSNNINNTSISEDLDCHCMGRLLGNSDNNSNSNSNIFGDGGHSGHSCSSSSFAGFTAPVGFADLPHNLGGGGCGCGCGSGWNVNANLENFLEVEYEHDQELEHQQEQEDMRLAAAAGPGAGAGAVAGTAVPTAATATPAATAASAEAFTERGAAFQHRPFRSMPPLMPPSPGPTTRGAFGIGAFSPCESLPVSVPPPLFSGGGFGGNRGGRLSSGSATSNSSFCFEAASSSSQQPQQPQQPQHRHLQPPSQPRSANSSFFGSPLNSSASSWGGGLLPCAATPARQGRQALAAPCMSPSPWGPGVSSPADSSSGHSAPVPWARRLPLGSTPLKTVSTPNLSTPSRIITVSTPLRPCSRAKAKEMHDDIRAAVEEQSVSLLHVALQKRHPCHGEHTLHEAIRQANLPAVRLLLEGGAETNARCHCLENGCELPLQLATFSPSFLRSSDRRQVVELLLQAGADPSPQRSDLEANTPLHDAVRRGDLEVVQVLLRYGANPNAMNGFHETPLQLALRPGGGDFFLVARRMVQCLLDAGACPLSADRQTCLTETMGSIVDPEIQSLVRGWSAWWRCRMFAWVRSRGDTPIGDLVPELLLQVASFM